MTDDQYDDRLRRLQDDYFRGAIGAEEYERLRKQLQEEEVAASVQPQPMWPPPPAGAPYAGYPGVALPGVDPLTGARLAGWGRRAAALLLDSLIYILSFIPTIALGIATEDPATEEPGDVALWLLVVQLFIVPIVYGWLAVGRWGATLGKHIVGIRVRRSEDAGRVGYARALGRVASVLFLSFCSLPLLISYLWPLWDSRNQTLHDKMASTIVVKN
jgi:uncharacterized RDD family membrane protein YckC